MLFSPSGAAGSVELFQRAVIPFNSFNISAPFSPWRACMIGKLS